MFPQINFIIGLAVNLMQILHLLRLRMQRMKNNWEDFNIPPIPNFVNILNTAMSLLRICMKCRKKRKKQKKCHNVIKMLRHYRVHRNGGDFWNNLEQNWDHFFWMTGEIPSSLNSIVRQLQTLYRRRLGGRKSALDVRNQVLLTFIWLRKYPTLQHLATHFSIPVTSVHRIIHRIIPLLHTILVPKYIKWHDMNHWRSLQGFFPTWPKVVAILDCTPFRISKPAGNLQRLFYRGDRHIFFLNWLVVIDVEGFITLSRPGFSGHISDSTVFNSVRLPVLPDGLQIMADRGFANQKPLLIPISRQGQPIRGLMLESFRSCRNTIERCFGTLKTAYTSAGTRRFRNRRWISPLVANLTASLCNRKKKMFADFHQQLSLN